MEKEIKICVFGASSEHLDKAYIDAAHELGRLMADRDWQGITGAGRAGLMRAVSDGVLSQGGVVTGIIPKFMVDNGWDYPELSATIVTQDMHQRKHLMADMADAFVALPGGCGTLEELMEIFTWRQLNIVSKPIDVLNTAGFYNPLIAMIEQCIEQGFMKTSHKHLWSIAQSPQEAISLLEAQLQSGLAPAECKY